MEELRESIMYKDTPIEICFKKFSISEQYEIIRIINTRPLKKFTICTHENTNAYIDRILKKIHIDFFQCFSKRSILE